MFVLDRLCSSIRCVSALPYSGCNLTRVDRTSPRSLQPTNYIEACAHPDAEHFVLHGRTGPVIGVEAGGTLFVEDDAVAAVEAVPAPSSTIPLLPLTSSKVLDLEPAACSSQRRCSLYITVWCLPVLGLPRDNIWPPLTAT